MKVFGVEFDETIETPLCRLMKLHGSDKGGEGASHSYTPVYHALFSRMDVSSVFELGIYSGASLRAWRDYFPSATVYGADHEPKFLFHESRICSFLCDETVAVSVDAMWSQSPSMDVIVDDALHTIEAQLFFFERSLHKLRTGGLYVIEDVADPHRFVQPMKGYDCEIVKLPLERNQYNDNNLVIVRR